MPISVQVIVVADCERCGRAGLSSALAIGDHRIERLGGLFQILPDHSSGEHIAVNAARRGAYNFRPGPELRPGHPCTQFGVVDRTSRPWQVAVPISRINSSAAPTREQRGRRVYGRFAFSPPIFVPCESK